MIQQDDPALPLGGVELHAEHPDRYVPYPPFHHGTRQRAPYCRHQGDDPYSKQHKALGGAEQIVKPLAYGTHSLYRLPQALFLSVRPMARASSIQARSCGVTVMEKVTRGSSPRASAA